MKEIIIEHLYRTIKVPYQFFFKKSVAWKINKKELLLMPQETLGFHLGCFLIKYNFDIQPSLEEHDIYHVLTNNGVTVKDEIHMQFYLMGNGKKSPFVFIVVATGLLFYPFEIKRFLQSHKKGRQAHQFYYLDFYKMLPIPLQSIQTTFNIK